MHHLALLGFTAALASPALAQLRVLYQNDLSFNASTSALLVLQDTLGSDAASACAGYSEQLLSSVTPDIEDQIRYLVYAGELQNSSRLHLAPESSPALRFARRQQADCRAYNVGVQFVSSVNCSESLVSIVF
jgi:acetylcholinesterase